MNPCTHTDLKTEAKLETNAYFPCLSLQEKLMGHLGVVLYEYLGEEYPEVLGSILGALKAIVNVIGMSLTHHEQQL